MQRGDRLPNINVDRQKIEVGPAHDFSLTIDRAFGEKFLTY
jgi:hypothetical protein